MILPHGTGWLVLQSMESYRKALTTTTIEPDMVSLVLHSMGSYRMVLHTMGSNRMALGSLPHGTGWLVLQSMGSYRKALTSTVVYWPGWTERHCSALGG